MPDIDPCPFCGSNRSYVGLIEQCAARFFRVTCSECDAYGPPSKVGGTTTREDAVSQWNNRANKLSEQLSERRRTVRKIPAKIPCPLCNSKNLGIVIDEDEHKQWAVCFTCRGTGPKSGLDIESDDVIAAWGEMLKSEGISAIIAENPVAFDQFMEDSHLGAALRRAQPRSTKTEHGIDRVMTALGNLRRAFKKS